GCLPPPLASDLKPQVTDILLPLPWASGAADCSRRPSTTNPKVSRCVLSSSSFVFHAGLSPFLQKSVARSGSSSSCPSKRKTSSTGCIGLLVTGKPYHISLSLSGCLLEVSISTKGKTVQNNYSPVCRWGLIAGRIPGRKPEEIERFWIMRHCESLAEKRLKREEEHHDDEVMQLQLLSACI
ncbi:hypothetical protein GW17_00057697, partial [Ensete ventricosum]